MMSDGPTAVIFDMDGVLIDSSEAHFESWRRLAADLGRSITREQFRASFGRQNRDIIPMQFGRDLSPAQVEELSETKERYYREIVADGVPILPGAVALVRSCHEAGMPCAIGSSAHPENIALALRQMGIEHLIDSVVSGRDVRVGKPDPQVFLVAAERLGVAPERCVVIEDAPAGVDAALAAGMTAIAVTTEHAGDRLNHAHLVVDSLVQLDPGRIRAVASQGGA